jgi:hypothetical protein
VNADGRGMGSLTGSSAHVPFAGEDLPELLANLAEAPDFAGASGMLLEQLAEAAGASRALLLVLDRGAHALELVQRIGIGENDIPRPSIALGELTHPIIVAARGLEAVRTEHSTPIDTGLPFERWIALPLPQPQFRGAPSMREARGWDFEPRFSGCALVSTPASEKRRR